MFACLGESGGKHLWQNLWFVVNLKSERSSMKIFSLLESDMNKDHYHVIVRELAVTDIRHSDIYHIVNKEPKSWIWCENYISGAYQQMMEIRLTES